MDILQEKEILNELINYNVPIIPDETRFWMVRTQKGYFYTEFLAKKFVAIAWNSIDKFTDFSEQAREHLQDDIMVRYEEINRPSTVVNKCHHFIHEIKENDILVIPSKGSEYITFALAKEYYEEVNKTVELEKKIIDKIRNNDVNINDVSCPYKKRRRIKILRTIKSEDLNYSLYRAISNYHGLSNLDSYSRQILNALYNCYSFRGTVVLVYNIRKTEPIKPSELSGLLYSSTACLSQIINEDYISTQVALNSPGDVVYVIEQIWTIAKDNWWIIVGLLIFFGGGSALSFKVNGVVDIIKNIINAPSDIRIRKSEADEKELEVLAKRIELYEKIKASGINPKDLENPLEILSKNSISMKSTPISLEEDFSIPIQENAGCEIIDLDDDQE